MRTQYLSYIVGIRKSPVICAIQLADDLLLKMLKVMVFFIVRNCSFFMGIISCSSVALV